MRKKRRKTLYVGWLIFLLLGLAVFSLIFFWKGSSLQTLYEKIILEEATTEKNKNSIAIPGYEVLELKANSKEQTLCLSNPPQNDCYFKISLSLEDGTLVWESELIEPGKTSKPLILTKILRKGTYTNAILKYECFKMDGETPLNGAETKLTLRVK